MKSPGETFDELLKMRGLSGRASLSVEEAREIFCSYINHEQQSKRDELSVQREYPFRSGDGEQLPRGMIASWFRNGSVIHAPKRSGKTTALLDYIVQKFPRDTRVGFIGAYSSSEFAGALSVYRLQGGGELPKISFAQGNYPEQVHRLQYFSDYAVVDDWWELNTVARAWIHNNLRVVAAVGTVPAGMPLPLSGILTPDEIDREIEKRVFDDRHRTGLSRSGKGYYTPW